MKLRVFRLLVVIVGPAEAGGRGEGCAELLERAVVRIWML